MNPGDGKILVVDDNEVNRDMLSRRLKRSGFDVETAANGKEALKLVDAGNYDLILLDIMLPILDGLEVLRILRQTYPANELPIIMAAAKDRSEDVVEALELGANDYVTKPIDFPVALARVQSTARLRPSSRSFSVKLSGAARATGDRRRLSRRAKRKLRGTSATCSASAT